MNEGVNGAGLCGLQWTWWEGRWTGPGADAQQALGLSQ